METIKVEHFGEIPRGFTGIIECPDGSKEWCVNGKIHRVDGPAIECADGSKSWWMNGKCHRVDGPAWECVDGSKHWYLNDLWIFRLEPIGEYLIIEDGLPSATEWLGEPVSTLKVLTAKGFKYIPNLPGI